MSEPALAAMHSWLMELGNEGRSPRTITAYESDVSDSLEFIAGQLRRKPEVLALSEVTRDLLVAAIAEFRTRPDPRYTKHPEQASAERAPSRVARRVAALKVFFKWCYATGRIPADPAALLRSPKRPKSLPKALEPEAARAAMTSAGETRWPERDTLIVVLALTTGMRLEEMATLRIEDLVGKPPRAVNVTGKGNKQRRLPLPPPTQEALAAFLPTRTARLEKMNAEARTLIVSTRPKRARSGRLIADTSKAGVAYVVDRVLRRVGARRRGSRVHVLRHTFATLGLRPDPETGQPAFTLRQLQAALGHANLATIQVYAEVSDEELVRAAAAHPLALRSRPRSGADQQGAL